MMEARLDKKVVYCPCGKRLHYSDPVIEFTIHELVARLGPTVPISANGRTYRVPRHYVALHGVKASDLPELAARYHFEEAMPNV
jgi:hypothetical protein